jgi:hypothetical protein
VDFVRLGGFVRTFLQTQQQPGASPGLLVRGSGFLNPRERSVVQMPGFSPGG